MTKKRHKAKKKKSQLWDFISYAFLLC